MAKANKLTMERSHLLAALSAVTSVVETRNTYPILANVLLSTGEDSLTVRGTDLDIQITTSVPASGSLPTITAPAKKLADIVKKLDAGAEITLEWADEVLTVKSGKSRFKLGTIDAASFPELEAPAFATTFEIDLAAMFGRVEFAISNEETRYYLNGIFLLGHAERLTAVATDGHRLVKQIEPATTEAWPAFTGIIVPRKTVGVVPKGVVTVSIGDNKIRFAQGNTVILSKLIEGTFPDYERVIPKANDKILTAERALLIGALDRVATIMDGRKGVKLSMTDDQVALEGTGDHDSANDEVVGVYAAEPMEIGFSATYLADVLRAVSGAEVRFAFNDAGSPTVITGDNDNWLSVLMPMRVA